MNASVPSSQRLLYLVMSAVLVWGTVLALGAFLFGIDQERGGVHFAPNPVRGGIVFLFVLGFVGSWLLLVRRQQSVRPRDAEDDESDEPPHDAESS